MFFWPPEVLPRSVPPKSQSLPVSPSRLSLPPQAKSLSLPPLPMRLSSPLVPLRKSGPLVPILVTASAIPLATNRIRAMVATITMVRLIFYPSSFFAYATVSKEVGLSGRRRKTHTPTTPSLPPLISVGIWASACSREVPYQDCEFWTIPKQRVFAVAYGC